MEGRQRVELVTLMDDFLRLRDDWEKLFAESSACSIFSSWDWARTWCEVFLGKGRELFTVVVYRGDEIVGIAPWFICNIKWGPIFLRKIEFIGAADTGADYLDVISRTGKEEEVANAVYDYLFVQAKKFWDVCQLRYMVSDSLFLVYLQNDMDKNHEYYSVRLGAFCPRALLGTSIEEFFKSISTKRRKRFSRERRILYGSEGFRHISAPVREQPDLVDTFFELYEKRWGQRPSLKKFIYTLAKKLKDGAGVTVDIMEANGQAICGAVHLYCGKDLFMYLFGVDRAYNSKISVGNVLVGVSIEKGIEEGFATYDFLKGTEEYKFYWTAEGRRLVDFEAYSTGIGSRLYALAGSSKKLIKALSK